jgi:hypothetical protein
MSSSDAVADVEKRIEASQTDRNPLADSSNTIAADEPALEHDAALDVDEADSSNKYLSWAYRLEYMLGFEVRGIRHVKKNEQTEKTTLSFLQIVMMWLSINTASQNITLASIGQSVFGLGFLDAALCSVLGGIVGTIPVAYTAGWGPWSGNRTLACFHSCLVGIRMWRIILLTVA